MEDRVLGTAELAELLGVPEWRLNECVRRRDVPRPQMLSGRRLWTPQLVELVRSALAKRGVVPGVADTGSVVSAGACRPERLASVFASLLAAGRTQRGGVYVVRVAHEDACGQWFGEPCDCDADVTVKPLNRVAVRA